MAHPTVRAALAVALLTGLLLAGCTEPTMPARPALEGPWPDGPIVAFGDSYTEGRGARASESFPARMTEALGIPVLNEGINGQTAAEALPRLQRDTLAHKPRLVIVEFGVNEAFRGYSVSRCTDALDKMLTEFGKANVPVVLVGVRFAGFQENFDAELRTLAARHGTGLVVDALRGVLDDERYTDDGGYHPNGAGYAIFESRIRPEVERALGGGLGSPGRRSLQ